jgi:hypothetical protein
VCEERGGDKDRAILPLTGGAVPLKNCLIKAKKYIICQALKAPNNLPEGGWDEKNQL